MRIRRQVGVVEALETRSLLSGGSVLQSGGLVTITPAPTGQNVAVVSYASGGLDVTLNGTSYIFSLKQVGFIYDIGTNVGGSQTFENETSLHTVFWGGSGTNVDISDGNAQDEFFGGSGTNLMDAGSGYDVFIGGTGANTFTENANGSGIFTEVGGNNTVIGSYKSYVIN